MHGFGGSWKSTWTQDVPAAPRDLQSVFWLQDLLPEDFPHCAIYSVRHDDAFFCESNFRLLMEEHLKCTPLDQRSPIVFIAHSLGGAYLKHVPMPLVYRYIPRS